MTAVERATTISSASPSKSISSGGEHFVVEHRRRHAPRRRPADRIGTQAEPVRDPGLVAGAGVPRRGGGPRRRRDRGRDFRRHPRLAASCDAGGNAGANRGRIRQVLHPAHFLGEGVSVVDLISQS
jgi:hypothetical protein